VASTCSKTIILNFLDRSMKMMCRRQNGCSFVWGGVASSLVITPVRARSPMAKSSHHATVKKIIRDCIVEILMSEVRN
jgi:pyruvate/2-oxoacid:ferredoxin oxidoreductase beta subunit